MNNNLVCIGSYDWLLKFYMLTIQKTIHPPNGAYLREADKSNLKNKAEIDMLRGEIPLDIFL